VDLEEEREEEDEEEEDNEGNNKSLVPPCRHGTSEAGSSDKESNTDDDLYCLPGSTSWFGQTIHTLAKYVPPPRRTVLSSRKNMVR